MSKRDEYVGKLKAQLDQWNTEVAKWEAKAQKAQAGARVEYEKQLKEVRRQRDQALPVDPVVFTDDRGVVDTRDVAE